MTRKFIVCLLLISGFAKAQVGVEKIIVEKYYISDANDAIAFGGQLPVGSVTYRIFVDMLPGYKFQAAFGLPGHELRLATTTSFFNNEEKGAIIPNIIPKYSLEKNTVMLDSWLSVGAAAEGSFGILKADDDGIETIINADGFLQSTNLSAGIPMKVQDGLMAGVPKRVSLFGIDSIVNLLFSNKTNMTSGAVLSTTAGSWLCLKGANGPTTDNRVLIAQLTTDGIFSFELNIQVGAPDGSIQQYVAKDPVGKEILLNDLIYSSINISKNPPRKNHKIQAAK